MEQLRVKVRPDPIPYTAEDADIWVCVGLWPCFALNDFLELNSAIGDRRDADLMLWAQQVSQFGDAAVELDGIDCRGWTQREPPIWP